MQRPGSLRRQSLMLDTEKQRIANELMRDRSHEWTDTHTLNIFCGTFNANGRIFDNDNDNTNLLHFIGKRTESGYDIVALGMQEIVPLNINNVIMDGTMTEERSNYWRDNFLRVLQLSGDKYRLKAVNTLVGIVLYVFVKNTLYSAIYDVRTTTAAVGVLGMMGNKGGITVAFRIYDSNICFVCSHLAPKRGNVLIRNSNYQNILAKTSLTPNLVDEPPLSPWHKNADPKFIASELSIMDYDVVFWLGDLNYHVDESISTEEVFQLVEDEQIDILRAKDQLINERLAMRVFQGFQEGPLTFAPTYKYEPGTNIYDRRPDKKIRAPAWCDRILWYTINKRETVRQVQYGRSEMNMSDHRPVYAIFEVEVNEVNLLKERETFSVVAHLMDKYENDVHPRIHIENKFIEFGIIQIGLLSTASIVVENTGSSIAYWNILNDSDANIVVSDWLLCVPSAGLLMPNQKVTINVTAHVRIKHVTEENVALVAKTKSFEEILVLRVKGGGDSFCVVTATVDTTDLVVTVPATQMTVDGISLSDAALTDADVDDS